MKTRKKSFINLFFQILLVAILCAPIPAGAFNFKDTLDKVGSTLDSISKILSGNSSSTQTPSSKSEEISTDQTKTTAETTEKKSGFFDSIFGKWENTYEQTMGEQTHNALKKEPGLFTDAKMMERLGKVAKRLVPCVNRKDLTWRFAIVNSEEVNAFAAPGGYVYVTRGLMKTIGSDDELAGVLAHELGHVDKKHGIRQAEKAGLMAVVVGLLGTKDETKKCQAAASIAAYFTNLKFSRDDEYEADRCSVKYSTKAGYNQGLITFFNRINNDSASTKITKYFSTHPPTTDRIKRVQNEINLSSKKAQTPTTTNSELQISTPNNSSNRVQTSTNYRPNQVTQTQAPTIYPLPRKISYPTSAQTPTYNSPNPSNNNRPIYPVVVNRTNVSAEELKVAYDTYLIQKRAYETKISEGASSDEIMSASRKFQTAKNNYIQLKNNYRR